MFFLLSTTLYAQEVFTQYSYWLRYQNQLIFSPRFQWTNEFDNRRFFDPDVALQFITHSRLHYKWKQWDFGGGLTYSVAFASKNKEGYDHATAEIRPVIEAQHEWILKHVTIQNRLRIDCRFTENTIDENVFQSSTYVTRYRYRFQLRIPLNRSDKHSGKVTSLRLADEIMVNSKKNTFDQYRIYATLELPLSQKLSIETGYLYIYQQRFGKEEFFRRHVVRLSLVHRVFVGG
jgi:Protein of unknown function (DUF2490)